MRPYVVTHMAMSLDGRIVVKNRAKVKGVDAYERVHKMLKGNAWMVGRVTMEHHFARKRPAVIKPSKIKLDRSDFVGFHENDSYAISIDESGKLAYKSSSIDGDHLIVVLAAKVSDDYLQFLRAKGISYIFGGASKINFSVVMEKLARLFHIKRLLLEGGGGINGSVLNAGLVDEISILQLPVVDGTAGTPTIFDIGDPSAKPGIKLKLKAVKKMPHDVLWVRYNVLRTKK